MKISMLLAIFTMAFTLNAHAFTDGTPPGELRIGCVEISAVNAFRTDGDPILGGPGTANVAIDGYTAPSWATTSPSIFSIEQYSFPTSLSYIDHKTIVRNNAGPWPTPVTLAYIWQICNNGDIFPPRPRTYGTDLLFDDGGTLVITLPYAGIWYITTGIGGFSTGTWDWMWLARYDGIYPIPVWPLGTPGNDACGGSYYDLKIYTESESVGAGEGAGRPWCFEVY
jgi:hypothetical protein